MLLSRDVFVLIVPMSAVSTYRPSLHDHCTNQAFHAAFTVSFVPSCLFFPTQYFMLFSPASISVCGFHASPFGDVLPPQLCASWPLLPPCPALTAPSPLLILSGSRYSSAPINTMPVVFASSSIHFTRRHDIFSNFHLCSRAMSTLQLLSIFPLNIDLKPANIQIIVIVSEMSVRSGYKNIPEGNKESTCSFLCRSSSVPAVILLLCTVAFPCSTLSIFSQVQT